MTPDTEAQLQAEATALASTRSWFDTFIIHTGEDLEQASELAKAAKRRWHELEEQRTGITRPIHEALRRVQALFKPVQEPLEWVERTLKQRISDYTLAQRRAQEEAMREASLALRAGADPAPALAALVPAPSVPGITVRERWAWRVVDEGLVPREYLSIDPAKVQAAIWYADTATPPRPIPGLEFYREGAVTVRR